MIAPVAPVDGVGGEWAMVRRGFAVVVAAALGMAGALAWMVGIASAAPGAVRVAISSAPQHCSTTLPSGTVVGMATTADGRGYWIASSTGQVAACGDATFFGNG